ncbi:MAG: sigma-54-dependent Fis family transcriptional regulator, partial [Rhodocyclales bacterium]|nr:sigma-54-dependent Fis family transcriptional regulator [Rhodocyclales bacterium]
CLTDMRLPDGEGLELVRLIGETRPELPVAVITAHGSMENAVCALKAGAFDYLSKPVSLEQLRALIRSAIDLPNRGEGAAHGVEQTLLGDSAALQQVRGMIERVARSQAPVYISGESGSGKELAARLIHQQGARAAGAFVGVNCGAIPETLMESEFFGYRKGAFTGAEAERDGFFQAADGGTLFLDEVADLPLPMQVKLLRAIQEKRVRKVGATAEEAVDARIICATHQDLKALVEQGRFRQDLFYRLNVIEIRMPNLRECSEDIPLLAGSIVARLAAAAGRMKPQLDAAAVKALQGYTFPGNVRELENILERALALLIGDTVCVADLQLAPCAQTLELPQPGQLPLQDYLDHAERQAILDALQKTRFNRTAAARLLGVTFRSLRYRMDRLGLND